MSVQVGENEGKGALSTELEPSHIPTTPLAQNGTQNVVAHILAIGPVLVTVIGLVCITILAIDRVLHGTDVVTLISAIVGGHYALAGLQSVKKTS